MILRIPAARPVAVARPILRPATPTEPAPAPRIDPALLGGENKRRDVGVLQIKKPTEGARIAALPVVDYWHPLVVAEARAWAASTWRRPEATLDFLDTQAVSLYVAALEGGLLGQIVVGEGKTLLSFLLAEALGAHNPILFHPASVTIKTELEWRDYNRHFRLPRNLRRMAYEKLSSAKSTDVLDRLLPDCIIMDEAHKLRNRDSARAKRVDRYMEKHPGVKVVVLSGTLTSTTIMDYSHFSKWCLKRNSVTPLESGTIQSFRIVLDAKPVIAEDDGDGGTTFVPSFAPGNQNWVDFSPLWPGWSAVALEERQAAARQVWAKRLASAPGVVVTVDSKRPCGLVFRRRRVETPRRVIEAIQKLDETWCRDDGEELRDAKDLYRVAIQMSQGFYYRWVWPNGQVDTDWLEARSAWHRMVRQVCKRGIPHCDSPLWVGRQVAAGNIHAFVPNLAAETVAAREEWRKHEGKRWNGQPHPPVETVWIDDFIVNDAMAWLKEHPAGLVWYAHTAMAEALARRGIPVYGGGTNPTDDGIGKALSIEAHCTGKNLQKKHSENYVLCWPPSGEKVEQLIGRTHRQYQPADEVVVEYLDHVGPALRALEECRRRATYMRDSTGSPQKLLYGTWE